MNSWRFSSIGELLHPHIVSTLQIRFFGQLVPDPLLHVSPEWLILWPGPLGCFCERRRCSGLVARVASVLQQPQQQSHPKWAQAWHRHRIRCLMHILLYVLHNYTKYHQAIDRSLNLNCNCVTLWILTLCIINQQQSSMTKVNNILMLKKQTSCKISSNTEKGQSHLLILGLVNQFCLALSIISLIREVYWLNALHLKNVKLQLLSFSAAVFRERI